jgi:hypothetical protein
MEHFNIVLLIKTLGILSLITYLPSNDYNLEEINMKKKLLGSVVLASALCMGLGAVNSEAASWNNSTIKSKQNSSGDWSKLTQYSSEVVSSNASGHGQASFVKGSQWQFGKSTGPAEASQSQDIFVDVGDVGSTGTTVTQGQGDTSHSASVSGPSYVLQNSRTTNATFHFQGSIKGGPSLQSQLNNHHSTQSSIIIGR